MNQDESRVDRPLYIATENYRQNTDR